ncbi:hypothetical protein [Arenimonas sp.]|uniref:hypothetical protein n=1 Tax=Arenimonas sp. TaxID=1872635 RepID=UPI0025B81AC9|nr:hypothetical protein [Arenimonas sp.]
MGTVIELDESKGWKLPTPQPAVASLAGAEKRDRVQIAHVLMLDHTTKVMACVDDITRKGFVPIGFTAHLEDGVTVMVEPPAEGLIDRRRDLTVCHVRGHNYLWFLHEGVRVAWQYTLPKEIA